MSDFNYSNAPMQPENKTLSIVSFILGCVGIVAWCLPIIGYPVTIAGIITGAIGIKKGGKVFAIIGIALSALFLLATLGNSIAGVMMNASQYM